MSGPAAILRELHRLKRYAKDLQDRLDRGPRQLRAQQANVAKQEETLRQGQEASKKLKVTILEQEGSLKVKNQQIAKHEKQLEQAASKKEYDALKLEIANERKEVARLEDQILERMAEAEEQAAQLPELEKAVRQAKADLEAFERESGQRLAALTEERARTLKQLAEVETTIPADVREIYERVVRGLGEDALAAAEGRACAACYTEVTAQIYNELLDEKFVQCHSCGRILYLPAP